MSFKILIAEDEEITLKHLTYALEKEGFTVKGTTNGREALESFKADDYDIVLADIKMPEMDGLTLLNKVKEEHPDTEVMIITGFGSIESAVEAMKMGAADYITKPFNFDELLIKIKRVQEKKRVEKENIALKISLGLGKELPFVARSKEMKRVVGIVNGIANSDCNVLLTGESGVGKGLVAKLIHYTGPRKESPFLALNCAIFTEELLASELFGHEKGAFTGAVVRKQGLLEVADRGTLFLDEITEMSPAIQAKLLKVIEDKEFLRVGGTIPVKVDVRFIAATNQNISEAVATGKFREDLYYRLNVMDIYIAPLRDRKEDIVPLSKHFLKKYVHKANKQISGFAKEAIDLIRSYGFPGNVRELENIIERAVILEKGTNISPESLPQTIKLFQVEAISPQKVKSLEEVRREYVEAVLEFAGGNKTKAAELLGISRTNLWRILKEQ